MNLYDKSLKLALLASLALLTACPPDKEADDTAPSADADTDADTDADSDADSDTDSDTDADTGLAQFFFLAEFTTDADGAYVAASFGYGMYGMVDQEWACTAKGNLPYEGDAAAGCPDCDWAFDAGGVTGSVVAGPYCDQFFEDGAVDTYGDYSWGFSEVYLYDYKGTDLEFTNTVFLNVEDEWFPFAFNYNGRDWVAGDATAASVVRPAFAADGSGYTYYYYYR